MADKRLDIALSELFGIVLMSEVAVLLAVIAAGVAFGT